MSFIRYTTAKICLLIQFFFCPISQIRWISPIHVSCFYLIRKEPYNPLLDPYSSDKISSVFSVVKITFRGHCLIRNEPYKPLLNPYSFDKRDIFLRISSSVRMLSQSVSESCKMSLVPDLWVSGQIVMFLMRMILSFGREDISDKYWKNTEEILDKYWTNTEQILDKYWTNTWQIRNVGCWQQA